MNVPSHDDRPSLLRDVSFWGLNLTQFLGAFNDNLFKQLVMLLCVDLALPGKDLQGWGSILFSVPFIVISGFAGFLSDRYRKRTIIILCKLAEVLIVLIGMVGFFLGSLPFLLGVLCLMGIHSAFFGPSKYGIVPEMLRDSDLPRANGMMLMATFLAIIFGFSAAGFAKQKFSATLWMASLPCLVIAVMGLVTSLAIRRTPVAQPGLRFEFSSIAIAPETRKLLRAQPTLLGVLLMSSVFWFAGGTIYPLSINSLCRKQFHFSDLETGLLSASTGLGIAIGCVLAGILSKNRVRGWIVRVGAWGLVVSLSLMSVPGPGFQAVREEIRDLKSSARTEKTEPATQTRGPSAASSKDGKADEANAADANRVGTASVDLYYRGTLLGKYGCAVALIAVGLFAGFYSMPLQVYLQSAAPVEQKGRIIGALNLMNWIGIASAGLVYSIGQIILVDWLTLPYATLFGFAAVLMLPVAVFYRPPNT